MSYLALLLFALAGVFVGGVVSLLRQGASRVAVVLALQTLVALCFGAWLLGEPVGAAHVLGGPAILVAAALSAMVHERGAMR